jgi:polyisoprenoid-binding protein YceI
MKSVMIALVLLLSSAGGFAQTSRVVSGKTGFSIKYWAGTCEGTFGAPQGTVKFDPNNLPASSINVTVAASSFHTGNKMRDKDVKDEKYLNAAAHPSITFRSSRITGKGTSYTAEGTLSIKGTSRKVSIPFKAEKRSDGGYNITSNFSINRLDYNVGKDGPTMKDLVSLSISAVIK